MDKVALDRDAQMFQMQCKFIFLAKEKKYKLINTFKN